MPGHSRISGGSGVLPDVRTDVEHEHGVSTSDSYCLVKDPDKAAFFVITVKRGGVELLKRRFKMVDTFAELEWVTLASVEDGPDSVGDFE